MSELEYIPLALLFVAGIIILYISYQWRKEKTRADGIQLSSDAIRDFWKEKYEIEWQNHQTTKAELDTYKHHQSETYKLLSAEAKVSTSGGVMGGHAMINVEGYSVVNKARYTFILRGESYLGWGQEGNVIKALPMDATVSTPIIEEETVYITFG